jgi:DHA3 family macrolide efflux protein-like MFS transporter
MMSQQQPEGSNWKLAFFPIWTGQAFSLLGSKMVQFALVWWLTETTGSATVLATATMVALIPEIVLGPIAGAYVDRWNRRVVMIVADALVALASVWLVYLFWVDAVQIWHIYVIMLVRAVGGGFHWPAMQASTSLMVPKEQLTRVAGLNQTLNGVLNIAGPPLGALLMALLPLQGVVAVDVGTALVAILPLLFVQIPQPEREDDGEQKAPIWVDIREGWRYIWGWPGLVVMIGAAMILKIALTPAFSLLPLVVSEHFQGDAAQLSLLEAVAGGGIVLGGLGLSMWGGFKRKILTTLVGAVVIGFSFLLLGMTPGNMFWLAIVSLALAGLAIPLVDGPIMAIMQSAVAPEIQGRVFTMMGSLLWLTSPISLSLAGPISDWLGLQVWYLAAGAMCAAFGVIGRFIPTLMNIEENGNQAKKEEAAPAPVETAGVSSSPAVGSSGR